MKKITVDNQHVRMLREGEYLYFGTLYSVEDIEITIPGTLIITGDLRTESGNITLTPVDGGRMTVKVDGNIYCDGTLSGAGSIYSTNEFGKITVLNGIKLNGFLGCMKQLVCYGQCEVEKLGVHSVKVIPCVNKG